MKQNLDPLLVLTGRKKPAADFLFLQRALMVDLTGIELNKYPSHSYGSVVGEVVSVSFIPHDKSYAVEVNLPDGLTTTNRQKIDYELGLAGKAEVVTSSRSVLSRIFGPVAELF